MTASHPRLAGDRYIVQRCIGTGGMGVVFLAYDDVLKGPRAIKVLKPSLSVRTDVRARFRTEAIAMSKLNHPGIVRVFDQGHEGLTSFIVMEYLPAGSLHHRIRREGPLARDVALSVCLDITEALQHAHQNGVIHRDIKPDNLLIGPTGAKLTDFGIARVAAAQGGLTRTGATCGTPSFMPPEQRLDSRKTTTRSDIYALCATLFVLVTGRDPVDLYEPDAREILLDGVDPRIADVIRRGCQAAPLERYADAAALGAALEAAREEPGSPRTHPADAPSSTHARPQDLDKLQQLWRSYTTPQGMEDGAETTDGSLQTCFSQVHPGEAGATPAVRPAETRPVETRPVETVSPDPGSGGRRRWRAAALAAGVAALLLGIVLAQTQTQTSTEPQSAAADPPDGDPAEVALLAADLSAATRMLADRAEEHDAESETLAMRAVLDVLSARPDDARAAFQRAAANTAGEGRRARAVRLADTTDVETGKRMAQPGTPAVAARLAAWSDVRQGDADPFIDALFLASMHGLLPTERLVRELTTARRTHPQHAIFALLRIRLQAAQLDLSQQQSLLEEGLTAFPRVAAIQIDRARLLARRGERSAAREALQQAVRLQPDATAPHILLANLAAQAGNEADRIDHLVVALSDTVPDFEQRQFLLEHGEMMAGLGSPSEAEKIWTAKLNMPVDETAAFRRTTSVRASRMALLLASPEASAARTDTARALLQGGGGTARQRARWDAELAYDDGVRAVRAGASGRGEAHLATLRAAAEAADANALDRELAALLELEIALATQEANTADLAAALQTHRPALAGLCSLSWIDARVAAMHEDLDALV
ncbi:MAG: protein kinase, partial [Myxococcota bacterium]|nr:protein kinase [Myxococcota bacterium]